MACFTTWATGSSIWQDLATSGNEVAGDLPTIVCGIVGYCHHTELADAPAARQVKIRLGLPVSRARLREWGTGANNVVSLGGCLSPLGKGCPKLDGGRLQGPVVWEGGRLEGGTKEAWEGPLLIMACWLKFEGMPPVRALRAPRLLPRPRDLPMSKLVSKHVLFPCFDLLHLLDPRVRYCLACKCSVDHSRTAGWARRKPRMAGLMGAP